MTHHLYWDNSCKQRLLVWLQKNSKLNKVTDFLEILGNIHSPWAPSANHHFRSDLPGKKLSKPKHLPITTETACDIGPLLAIISKAWGMCSSTLVNSTQPSILQSYTIMNNYKTCIPGFTVL